MDRTAETKSSTKIYIEQLQKRIDAPDCPLDPAECSSYQIALSAAHNATNGGGHNPESTSVAVGALICAITEEKLSQKARLTQLMETNRRENCPWEGKLARDKAGNPVLPVAVNGNTLAFVTKWFSISTGGKIGTAAAAAILVTMIIFGFRAWSLRQERTRELRMRSAVQQGVERAIEEVVPLSYDTTSNRPAGFPRIGGESYE